MRSPPCPVSAFMPLVVNVTSEVICGLWYCLNRPSSLNVLAFIPSTSTVVWRELAPRPNIRFCCIARDPPMSGRSGFTPGTRAANDHRLPPLGMASTVSRVRVCTRCTRCTSTTGASPETVIVSATAPTAIVTSRVSVKSPGSTTSSRIWVPNPGSENVTV